MGLSIRKNEGWGRSVIRVRGEEKNGREKDIVEMLRVEGVDGWSKEVKVMEKKGEGNYE